MSIWRHPRRKNYWVGEVRVRGKRVTAAGKTRAIVRERLEAKVRDAKAQIDTGFMQLCEAYLDDCQARNSEKTYRDKKATIKRLLSHLGSTWPTSHRILEYLQLRAESVSACVSNIDRKNLSAMFNWGRKFGLADNNPMDKIDPFPWRQPRKYIPPLKDIRAVLLVSGHYRDLLETIIYTLGRKSEILKLRWEDVNFNDNTITLRTRKRKGGGEEADTLQMPKPLGQILQRRFRQSRHTRQHWIFSNQSRKDEEKRYTHLYNLMSRLCKRAGVRPFGFHALRHYGASFLLSKGEDLGTIKEVLRHRNVRTTERYLHSISEAKKRAARVMEGVLDDTRRNRKTS